jgi:hypothetical protein
MAQQCINIGPRQRARRVRLGAGLLAMAILLGAVLLFEHAARPWRLLVFVPLLLGSIALLQVPVRTCVLLAARGLKDLDDGEVEVRDPAEQRQLAMQARRVALQAAAVATVLTVVFWSWASEPERSVRLSPYVAALEQQLSPGSVLSLVPELQAAAEQALLGAGRAGAVVALDPRDGSVKALFSVAGDRGDPLLTPQQPGSTFKTFMTIAAHRAGALERDTVLTCTGGFDFAGVRLTCPLAHGAENPVRALAVSCNSFYYQLAAKVDPARVAALTRELGWDARTGIELDDAPGVVPEPPVQASSKVTPRPAIDAVGHGEYRLTPLGLARAYAVFANGGKLVDLHLVTAHRTADGSVVPAPRPRPKQLDVDPAAIGLVLDGLRDAVASDEGRAHPLAIPGYPFFGKTGATDAPRRPNTPPDLVEEDRWFVAFAPLLSPELLVVARVERAQEELAAGRVARRLLEAFRALEAR